MFLSKKMILAGAILAATQAAYAGSDRPNFSGPRFLTSKLASESAVAPASTSAYGTAVLNVSGTLIDTVPSGGAVVCTLYFEGENGATVNSTVIQMIVENVASATATMSGKTFTCSPSLYYRYVNLDGTLQPGVWLDVEVYGPTNTAALPATTTPLRALYSQFVTFATLPANGGTVTMTAKARL